MIKTRIRNRIGESSLSYPIKIAIESPEKLCEMELENIVATLTYQKYSNQSINLCHIWQMAEIFCELHEKAHKLVRNKVFFKFG